jgi:hypothetical protein
LKINNAFSTEMGDIRYLKLDQTTPQTIINGVPLFNLGLKSPKIYPNADSTTAIQFNKADGTTNVLTIDTTNGNTLIASAGKAQFRDAATYISSKNANYLDFDAATGFRFNIGNVLIGKSAPVAGVFLDVYNASTWCSIQTQSGSSAHGGGLVIKNDAGFEISFTAFGSAYAGGSYGSVPGAGAGVFLYNGTAGCVFWNNQAAPMTFATSATERLTIAADGNVNILQKLGLRTASPTGILHITGTSGTLRDGSYRSCIELSAAAGNYPGVFFSGQSTTSFTGLLWTGSTSGNNFAQVGAMVVAVPSSSTNTDFSVWTNNARGTSSPTEKFTVYGSGVVRIANDLQVNSNSYGTVYGTGQNSKIHYDGTNLLINPKVVGTGILDVLGTLQTDGYNSADGSAGISTTFIDNDGNTITVKNGLITAKTAP